MNENPFDGARLKIERAKQHFAKYRSRFSALKEPNTTIMRVEPHPETGQEVLIAKVPKAITDDLRLCAADAIYNLRSALDIAVCASVRLTGKSPKETYFPHGQDVEGFRLSIGKNCKKVPDSVRAALTSLQPYHGGCGYMLRVLHDLNVADKHSDLLGAIAIPHRLDIEIDPRFTGSDGEMYRDKQGAPITDLRRRAEFTFAICFTDVEVIKNQSVTGILENLIKYTSDAIDLIQCCVQHLIPSTANIKPIIIRLETPKSSDAPPPRLTWIKRPNP